MGVCSSCISVDPPLTAQSSLAAQQVAPARPRLSAAPSPTRLPSRVSTPPPVHLPVYPHLSTRPPTPHPSSLSPPVNYQVALKMPHGVEMQLVSGGKWVPQPDINVWLNSLFGKFEQFVVYNDEVKGHAVSSSHGHCKGILAWSDQTISWLIHSVPKFPEQLEKLHIDPQECIYGQSFIFLEHIPRGQLDSLLSHIRLMNPYVYLSSIDFPSIPLPTEQITELQLGDGIIHVSKSGKWGKDLYEHLDQLNVELKCETSFEGTSVPLNRTSKKRLRSSGRIERTSEVKITPSTLVPPITSS